MEEKAVVFISWPIHAGCFMMTPAPHHLLLLWPLHLACIPLLLLPSFDGANRLVLSPLAQLLEAMVDSAEALLLASTKLQESTKKELLGVYLHDFNHFIMWFVLFLVQEEALDEGLQELIN